MKGSKLTFQNQRTTCPLNPGVALVKASLCDARAVKKVGALAINSELEINGLDQNGTLEERQQRMFDHLSSPHDMHTEADNNMPLTQPKINVSSTASKTESDIFEMTLLKVQEEQLTQRKCLDILLRGPNDDVEKDREARLNKLEEQSQAILKQIQRLKDLITNRMSYYIVKPQPPRLLIPQMLIPTTALSI